MKRFSDTLSVVETEGVFKPDLECAVTLAENNQASLMVITSAIQVGATGATIIPASGTGAHEA
jgi:hypothetical protein